MSILNMANDGLFNVLIVLTRVIIRWGPKSRDDLLVTCGGRDVVNPKQLGQTLTRWTDLGLFSEENERIMINERYRGDLGKDPDEAEKRLPGIIRNIALAPENNQRFWDSIDNRAADFNRGLAWILAQDVYSLDTSSHEKIDALEARQVTDNNKRMLQNDTRWNGLRTWMVYLGFARDGAQVTMDPTVALKDILPKIFDGEQVLPSLEFVNRAAQILPVLDGGAYRLQIEGIMSDSHWSKPPKGNLSTSLSRAIRRLDFDGLIAAKQRSDAEEGVILTGIHQRTWRNITHIHKLSEAQGRN